MKQSSEKGFALVLSLVLLLVMSLMGGTLIVVASGDHKNNNTSDEYQQTFYVAETALIEGEKYIVDNYLGHWISSKDDLVYDSVSDDFFDSNWRNRCERNDEDLASCDKTEEELIELSELQNARKTKFDDYKDNLEFGEITVEDDAPISLARKEWGKGIMYNNVEIDRDNMSLCMQSFKNFKTSAPPIRIAYELPDDHPRLGDFWNIVGPIVTANHLIELNTPRLGFTAAEQTRVLEQEREYLRRFRYTFFIQHVGYSTFRGGQVMGGSVRTTSAADMARQGSAYKVYGCGLMFNQNMTRVNIIVPLTSMTVMPY
tara:strand:+ start:1077 stop:2021 length:945 start_codon:yes stop_codon:yes gene_type:complete